MPRSLSLAAALSLLAALPAAAEDAALALGIERYERLSRAPGAEDVVAATEALAPLDFAVTAVPNARSGNAISALQTWAEAAAEADRVVAVLAGRFVTDGDRSWLLTADSGRVSLFGLGDRAISVESVMAVLARHPGRALLLVAGTGDDAELTPYLSDGAALADVPQGVTVITGPTGAISDFIRDELAEPGTDLIARAGRYRQLDLAGYTPPSLVLIPEGTERRAPEPEPEPEGPSSTETALWEGSRTLDTVAAYRNYLSRYPRGAWRSEAEDAIAAILAEPNRDARLAEERIELSRDERRGIQRDLTQLGYDTRGVDGIFGAGSRTAIRNWQQQNGFAQTSYLTPEQIVRLDAQATRAEAERAAEAERQRAERERLDRAYWDETGAGGTLAGLTTYLERYPEGLFAGTARERIEALQLAEAERADRADRQAWAAAEEAGRPADYRAYLERFPEGRFAQQARARIEAARRPSPEVQAAERALGLNTLTIRLIEQRLSALGFAAGAVDGQIDADTRRALSAYQEGQGLNATGFVDQGTIVRLIADGLEALR
ncbi:peptidoglycan-binding domain-containing protein [Wenxinia saemankumensis]|uniref:Peptidoglycan-binding (PGRP) domain of peptidoglycan hydrolases-containing protein n=1 Tax=Wenxinia saemankumensis TaxID=1447782 RepID=A0A1M6E5W3_9RHOB|nr:peptidoglycan-binding protein [Wenxinia saemankumensis]SHI80783.1 Peptidoglycan-binding (PGRP) domain of peptidoglycan hydrolases-containing protein [Wenxinia saemankumensis]